MTDVRLRWKGHSAADISTDYKIYSDVATPNTYALLASGGTQDATSPYAPVAGVLSGAITATATSLTLIDATNFSNGDYVKMRRETILLGGKNSNTFTSCTRGVHNTVRQSHADTTPVYKMHEMFLVTGVNFGTRHVIRYRVRALISAVELTAAELVVVKPTTANDDAKITVDKIVIWGIEDDVTGVPAPDLQVSMSVAAKGFNPGTAETINARTITTTTDASGYWELIAHRDVARVGGAITINVNGNAYPLITVPDQENVCYLECL